MTTHMYHGRTAAGQHDKSQMNNGNQMRVNTTDSAGWLVSRRPLPDHTVRSGLVWSGPVQPRSGAGGAVSCWLRRPAARENARHAGQRTSSQQRDRGRRRGEAVIPDYALQDSGNSGLKTSNIAKLQDIGELNNGTCGAGSRTEPVRDLTSSGRVIRKGHACSTNISPTATPHHTLPPTPTPAPTLSTPTRHPARPWSPPSSDNVPTVRYKAVTSHALSPASL